MSKRSKAQALRRAMAVPKQDRLFMALRHDVVVQSDLALAECNLGIALARAVFQRNRLNGLYGDKWVLEAARRGMRERVNELEVKKDSIKAARAGMYARIRTAIAGRTAGGAPEK